MSPASGNNSSMPGPLPPAGRPRRWVAVLLTLVIFLAGALTGGGAMYIYCSQAKPKLARTERIAAELKQDLDLTDRQVEQVKELINRRNDAMTEIRRVIRPRMEQQIGLFREDVKGILDPKQQRKWEAKCAELREKWLPPVPETQPASATAPAPAPGGSGPRGE